MVAEKKYSWAHKEIRKKPQEPKNELRTKSRAPGEIP